MTHLISWIVFGASALILVVLGRVAASRFGGTRRVSGPLATFYTGAVLLALFNHLFLPELSYLVVPLGALAVVAPLALWRARRATSARHRDAGPREDRHTDLNAIFSNPSKGDSHG